MSVIRQSMSQLTDIQTISVPWSKVIGISAAILMGVFIIYAVGFASPEVIHNAAHDGRHGLAFPCH